MYNPGLGGKNLRGMAVSVARFPGVRKRVIIFKKMKTLEGRIAVVTGGRQA